MNPEPFVIERTYNASVDLVWQAITDNEKMKQWYFDIAEFKPVVGFDFMFEAGPENKKYVHQCKITAVVPGKKLAYTWKYDGYAGGSEVTFELFEEGDKTRLKLTHTGLETFPTDNPDFAKASFAEGWNQIIGTSLKDFVEAAS